MTPTAIQADASVTLAPGPFSPVNALILDDSEFDRRHIRRLSRQTDLPIFLDEVSSIAALARVLEDAAYDVIFLDYHLPEGDGIKAMDLVRSNGRNGDCPIIMVTGEDESGLAVRALKLGCNDYITKARLTAESLKSAILVAIHEAEVARNDAVRSAQMANTLARDIMKAYSNGLQPELARIIRDIRSLKSGLSDPGKNIPGDLEAIEKRCVGMWSILLSPAVLSSRRNARH